MKNEIEKLRLEMSVGFIEIENVMKASNDKIIDTITAANNKIIMAVHKQADITNKGFLAIEEMLEKESKIVNQRLDAIESNLGM